MKKNIYITTTLPYVNAEPHIGHAREFVQADVFARIYRELDYNVYLNTGTDEHGAKIAEKAEEEGKSPQEYVDEQAKRFREFCELFGMKYDRFMRTTNEDHVKAAQEFWKICNENGYIYKKNYKTKYCVGCELEKTDSELVNGECPDHPGKPIEEIDEENYFFKFKKFDKKLLEFYEKNSDFVKPEKRFREIKSFVEQGLTDFSISRLKEKMPWGVPVPNDSDHVMYVWFDALTNYISTLGWPKDQKNFEKWWGNKKSPQVLQFCGKDNLRQQSAMWQAMLMSVNLPNSKRVYVNGFINVDGQKMSKTIGNVISPFEMVERYGVDATRYLLLSIGSFGEDTDVTWKKLDEKYNADLANGIGNLTSRIVTLYQKIDENFDFSRGNNGNVYKNESFKKEFEKNLHEGNLEIILKQVISHVQILDKYLEEKKLWEVAKTDEKKFKKGLKSLIVGEGERLTRGLIFISGLLEPFMSETAKKIEKSLQEKEKVQLFPRVEFKTEK